MGKTPDYLALYTPGSNLKNNRIVNILQYLASKVNDHRSMGQGHGVGVTASNKVFSNEQFKNIFQELQSKKFKNHKRSYRKII